MFLLFHSAVFAILKALIFLASKTDYRSVFYISRMESIIHSLRSVFYVNHVPDVDNLCTKKLGLSSLLPEGAAPACSQLSYYSYSKRL